MEERSLQFLKELLETPSPSGFEQAIQTVVRGYVAPFCTNTRTDLHGNVIVRLQPPLPKGNECRVMLAGHCDQIGLLIQHIDGEGFLYVQPIGGWDMQILLGQHLTVWGKNGPLAGVLSRKAPHLLSDEERKKVPQFTDVWVDIGAANREEAELHARIGDCVTVRLGFTQLLNNVASAPAMDDKVGVWVVMEAMRIMQGKNLAADVYSVSTVQEEIGLRGAHTSTFSIMPTVGIAVDVCHASDTPSSDKRLLGEVKLGAGPVVFRGPNINPRVFDRLETVAKQEQIPIQVRGVAKATGTDANAMQISGAGVAAGLIGIPNRYMHSPVETVHLDDLQNAAKLLAAFCGSIEPETSFIP
jgi:tetrahedral aminopeptidase